METKRLQTFSQAFADYIVLALFVGIILELIFRSSPQSIILVLRINLGAGIIASGVVRFFRHKSWSAALGCGTGFFVGYSVGALIIRCILP